MPQKSMQNSCWFMLPLGATALITSGCSRASDTKAGDTSAMAPASAASASPTSGTPADSARSTRQPQIGIAPHVQSFARRFGTDTIVCRDSARYETAKGVRYLHVHAVVARPGGSTDLTSAETVISTDPAGTKFVRVDTASVNIDAEGPWILLNATGVSHDNNKSSAQGHRIEGSTSGPSMGPLIIQSCGG